MQGVRGSPVKAYDKRMQPPRGTLHRHQGGGSSRRATRVSDSTGAGPVAPAQHTDTLYSVLCTTLNVCRYAVRDEMPYDESIDRTTLNRLRKNGFGTSVSARATAAHPATAVLKYKDTYIAIIKLITRCVLYCLYGLHELRSPSVASLFTRDERPNEHRGAQGCPRGRDETSVRRVCAGEKMHANSQYTHGQSMRVPMRQP